MFHIYAAQCGVQNSNLPPTHVTETENTSACAALDIAYWVNGSYALISAKTIYFLFCSIYTSSLNAKRIHKITHALA